MVSLMGASEVSVSGPALRIRRSLSWFASRVMEKALSVSSMMTQAWFPA